MQILSNIQFFIQHMPIVGQFDSPIGVDGPTWFNCQSRWANLEIFVRNYFTMWIKLLNFVVTRAGTARQTNKQKKTYARA